MIVDVGYPPVINPTKMLFFSNSVAASERGNLLNPLDTITLKFFMKKIYHF
jgi:hypothetical protein